MKIAVLILAHKNEGQLRILIDVLKTDFEVYVHFDSKSGIAEYFTDEPHVNILPNRYRTAWGSYNSILAELALLNAAYTDNCDFYILISGQDLPIASNETIKNYFSQNYRDYIECVKLPAHYWGMSGGIERISLYWETKTDVRWVAPFKKVGGLTLRLIQKKLNLTRPLTFALYGGSNWFNLTKEAVHFILTYTQQNKAFIDRFKHTRSGDEIFIQTCLMAFDYEHKQKIKHSHFRYFDWKTGPTYPRVLTIEDYDKLKDSGDFFARKFDNETDNAVIEKVLKTLI